MSTLSENRLRTALAKIVRKNLIEKQTAEVPELGTFRVEHVPSKIELGADQPILEPPRDTVAFSLTASPDAHQTHDE